MAFLSGFRFSYMSKDFTFSKEAILAHEREEKREGKKYEKFWRAVEKKDHRAVEKWLKKEEKEWL